MHYVYSALALITTFILYFLMELVYDNNCRPLIKITLTAIIVILAIALVITFDMILF